MSVITRRAKAKVKGKEIEYNETSLIGDDGKEIFSMKLELYNDLKLYEEYERLTKAKILKENHYNLFK